MQDAALDGAWGLMLGPIKSLSAPAICGPWYECIMGSTHKSGTQYCSGTDCVLQSVHCFHEHGIESHHCADSIPDWMG